MATSTQINAITALYVGYFDRAPDPAGLQFWIDQIDNGREFNTIAADFAASPEAIALYPYLTTPAVSSPAAFITNIYANLFGRAPDTAGLEFWTGVLNEGSISVADMIEEIIMGARDDAAAGTSDKTVLDNKIEVGLDWAVSTGNTPGFEFDVAAKAAAVASVNGVTEDAATVAAAKAATDAYVAGSTTVGDTLTLTAAVDVVNGTAADDTFVGVINTAAGAGGTFNTGDSIKGSTGNDTLDLIATTASTIVPASVTGVETVKVQDLAGATVNLANATGVTKLVAANSTAQATFSGVKAIADVEVNGGAGMTVTYDAAAVAGLTDAQNVAVNGATGTVNAAGIETFNVAATGKNTLTLTNDGDTVNVTGAGSVTFGGTLNVTKLDASANTGGVTGTIGAGNVAVTGGIGNDSFSFGAGLTAASTGVAGDVVNGGEGTDTVRVTTAGDLSAAAAAAPFNSLTSIERVAFDGNGVTLNGSTFSNAGITNIELNTTGADTINNAGSARMYEFGGANTAAATFNMTGASSTLNLVMRGTEGTAAANDGVDADVGAVTVNLAATAPAGTKATINIDSQGDLADVAGVAANFNDVGNVNAVAGSTIKITGAGNLDFAGLANNATIDASAATGNLVLEGSVFTDFDDGDGSAADGDAGGAVAVAFKSGADTITLGAGADTVQFGSGLASGVANSDVAATNTNKDLQIDVVNGFTAGAGGDVLDFTGNIVQVDSDYTALTAAAQAQIDALAGGAATLKAAADIAVAATAQTGAAGEWSAFTFQGQSYAVYDAADGGAEVFEDANDLLVQITGVTVANLTDANFA